MREVSGSNDADKEDETSPMLSSTSSEEDETSRSERQRRMRTAPKVLQYNSPGNPSYAIAKRQYVPTNEKDFRFLKVVAENE